MRKSVGRCVGVGLALAMGFAAAGETKEPAVGLNDAEFEQLVQRTAKIVRDSLKGKPDDKAAERARTAAIVIAAVAQYSQTDGNAARRATIRDAALRLAAVIKDDRFAEASRQAETLPKLPANPRAKTAPVQIMKQIGLAEVMHHFVSVPGGGTGAEKKLLDLAENSQARKEKALPARELKPDLVQVALRSAVVGQLVKGHEDDKVKKNPKAWRDYAEAMRKSGVDLAKAVEGKNRPAAWNALNRLNNSCEGCHKVFKK